MQAQAGGRVAAVRRGRCVAARAELQQHWQPWFGGGGGGGGGQQQQPQPQQAAAAAAQAWHQRARGLVKPPSVVYLPNFLHPDDAAAILKEYRQLRSRLKPELNTVAVGRYGCYLPRGSRSVAIFSSNEVAQALTERLRSSSRLFASDFPMELRTYDSARRSHMPWHKDEQLYTAPQWECVYTVENSSDSVTQWRDDSGRLHERATDPNSLLAVLAEGWDHRVSPVRRGSRAIIKFAMTTTSVQLPAFRANLERQAYAL